MNKSASSRRMEISGGQQKEKKEGGVGRGGEKRNGLKSNRESE